VNADLMLAPSLELALDQRRTREPLERPHVGDRALRPSIGSRGLSPGATSSLCRACAEKDLTSGHVLKRSGSTSRASLHSAS
jgi:hypothetical protein